MTARIVDRVLKISVKRLDEPDFCMLMCTAPAGA